jgi:hypothetical protein
MPIACGFLEEILREGKRSEPERKRSVWDIQVSRGSAIAEELERAIDRSQEISVVGS